MYEVDPESQKSLTDLIQETKKSDELNEIFNNVGLTGVINEKFLKSERKMKSIGDIVNIAIDRDEQVEACSARVKLKIKGRLNNALFLLKFSRKSSKEKWELEDTELRILWNTKS